MVFCSVKASVKTGAFTEQKKLDDYEKESKLKNR